MKKILSGFFGFFKYILFIAAFGLVFYGIMTTYGRLEKPLTDAVDVFIPFAFVLLVFLITLITRSRFVKDNLLFNFVSVFVFIFIIVVCLRAMFDKNMILYYRYGINFNPAYFADNLAAIQAMLYMIGGANVLLLICDIVNKKKQVVVKENNVKDEVASADDNEVVVEKKSKKVSKSKEE